MALSENTPTQSSFSSSAELPAQRPASFWDAQIKCGAFLAAVAMFHQVCELMKATPESKWWIGYTLLAGIIGAALLPADVIRREFPKAAKRVLDRFLGKEAA